MRVNEDIRRLEVAVDHALVVEVGKALEDLLADRFQVFWRELDLRLAQNTDEVVVYIFEDHVNETCDACINSMSINSHTDTFTFRNHHFMQFHDIFMSQAL